MNNSELKPFIREGLAILFVGLNPASISNIKGHYFSVRMDFWNQLYDSGLITKKLDKDKADITVFGTTKININNWSYGITDLVPEIAESDSNKIKPKKEHCDNLINSIIKYNPKVVILLHGKVLKYFLRHLDVNKPVINSGNLGNILKGCDSLFFNIAFPHGNTIPKGEKVEMYKEVYRYLMSCDKPQPLLSEGDTFSSRCVYPIKRPDGRILLPPPGKCWRFTRERFEALLKDGMILFDENGMPNQIIRCGCNIKTCENI